MILGLAGMQFANIVVGKSRGISTTMPLDAVPNEE
jgi:hypothetical protein